MTDLTRRPECASDLAQLAAETLNQLLALTTSIKHLHGVPGQADTVKHLAGLAELHALEWAEHFEEQAKLHLAIDREKRGDA